MLSREHRGRLLKGRGQTAMSGAFPNQEAGDGSTRRERRPSEPSRGPDSRAEILGTRPHGFLAIGARRPTGRLMAGQVSHSRAVKPGVGDSLRHPMQKHRRLEPIRQSFVKSPHPPGGRTLNMKSFLRSVLSGGQLGKQGRSLTCARAEYRAPRYTVLAPPATGSRTYGGKRQYGFRSASGSPSVPCLGLKLCHARAAPCDRSTGGYAPFHRSGQPLTHLWSSAGSSHGVGPSRFPRICKTRP